MRGSDGRSGALFSYVDLEARVPADHPLRVIREIVNDALASLDGEFCDGLVPLALQLLDGEGQRGGGGDDGARAVVNVLAEGQLVPLRARALPQSLRLRSGDSGHGRLAFLAAFLAAFLQALLQAFLAALRQPVLYRPGVADLFAGDAGDHHDLFLAELGKPLHQHRQHNCV